MLRWKDTVRRDLKAWEIKEEWATAEKDGKVSARLATSNRETAAKGEKVRVEWASRRLHCPHVVAGSYNQM